MCVQSVCIEFSGVFFSRSSSRGLYVLSFVGDVYGVSPYDIGLSCYFIGLKSPSGMRIGYILQDENQKGVGRGSFPVDFL